MPLLLQEFVLPNNRFSVARLLSSGFTIPHSQKRTNVVTLPASGFSTVSIPSWLTTQVLQAAHKGTRMPAAAQPQIQLLLTAPPARLLLEAPPSAPTPSATTTAIVVVFPSDHQKQPARTPAQPLQLAGLSPAPVLEAPSPAWPLLQAPWIVPPITTFFTTITVPAVFATYLTKRPARAKPAAPLLLEAPLLPTQLVRLGLRGHCE